MYQTCYTDLHVAQNMQCCHEDYLSLVMSALTPSCKTCHSERVYFVSVDLKCNLHNLHTISTHCTHLQFEAPCVNQSNKVLYSLQKGRKEGGNNVKDEQTHSGRCNKSSWSHFSFFLCLQDSSGQIDTLVQPTFISF